MELYKYLPLGVMLLLATWALVETRGMNNQSVPCVVSVVKNQIYNFQTKTGNALLNDYTNYVWYENESMGLARHEIPAGAVKIRKGDEDVRITVYISPSLCNSSGIDIPQNLSGIYLREPEKIIG